MAGVQSIERAFAILRALAVGPQGVTEVAERVDLPKSTVARLLAALEAEDAVSQDEFGGEYRLGDGLTDLTGGLGAGRSLAATARVHLLELAETLGETAGVSIDDGGAVFYLDHASLDSAVQVRDWTGDHVPLHLVPSGLAFLAHMPESRVENYLSKPLAATTPDSITDPDAIRERLELIRSAGYVWVYGEFSPDITSVAAPVFDADGVAVAALHVHGPSYRFPDPDRTHDIGLHLVEAAARLSAQLDDT